MTADTQQVSDDRHPVATAPAEIDHKIGVDHYEARALSTPHRTGQLRRTGYGIGEGRLAKVDVSS